MTTMTRKHSLDNRQHGIIGDTTTLDKMWFESGRLHGSADCRSPSMHNHRSHAYRFHENHIK